ncbi:MAG TPA: Crp/Fnr family transcriptional regulator [Blastocatellia bacterium]|nr:Crp/Fnr family transcriptional regulator [Blastocatellia bacterium]
MTKRPKPPGGVKKHQLTQRKKALTASALAQKIGYLHIEEMPDSQIFETLPTKSFSPHRIIRGKDELFLVRHGLVEIWHTRHDTLVKSLDPGVLFGDFPLLGQTMMGTRAITGNQGATITIIDADTAKEWIKTAPLWVVEMLGKRLAKVEGEHYRSRFQLADSRIAAYLLELAGENSTIVGLTHKDIGRNIGLYRETVTNMLDALKLDGVIEVGRMKIIILDKKALKELSEL